jgi:hypothetical protein
LRVETKVWEAFMGAGVVTAPPRCQTCRPPRAA